MKLRVIAALIGVLCLASSASALTRPQFQAKASKYAGVDWKSIRALCVCKEAGYMNRVGYLVVGTGTAGPPSLNLSAVSTGCGIPLFHNGGLDLASVATCNSDFVILTK